MSDDQLKPCPFCRKMDFLEVEKEGEYYFVRCDWDSSQGPQRLNEEDCMVSWNDRGDDENKKEEMEVS